MIRPAVRNHPRSAQGRPAAGFTLVELMITLTVLAVVMVVLLAVMQGAQRSRVATGNQIEAAQAGRAALDLMARDLRSAGYHADRDYLAFPQPPVAYIDSMQVLINADFSSVPADTIPRQPLAYNPTGSPRPYPLNGTPWQPPIKYRRGAEIVRWTLDVNNDGQVNAADIGDANGVDAQRTPNPSDYVLVRQVYGDSTGNIPNYNGGQIEKIALVRRPGGSVPPMFQVYLEGQTTPYDWSLGPLPPSQLEKIQRIAITVTAPSSRPDKRGTYAETRMHTEVNSIRNVPNFGRAEYTVDGYVYDDANQSQFKDPGELGLEGAVVRLGKYAQVTTASGYYIFRAPAGTYWLKHEPPPGFGVLTSPDSVSITIGPPANFSFADTARAGGWVDVLAYEDVDESGTHDYGEPLLQNVKVTMTPGGQVDYTSQYGYARLFAPVGSYSVTATAPDSFTVISPNPVTRTMSAGGSDSVAFGMSRTEVGKVTGTVYRDNNRNGARDAGESGIANVWVGITNDGGATILAYQYTDANGDYGLQVPINDPPRTTPYTVMAIMPAGYYATSTTAISPVWVQASATVSGNNFGMLGYQVIVLNASRVLSLASGDLVEKQGSDNGASNGRWDADIVLGADAGGTDNISVWFNQYDNTPVFDANPTYTRNAAQSVLSLSLDTLDSNVPKRRLDVVTGTKNALAGNFFVWFNQNSGGNEGYFPLTPSQSYRTADNGDVQAVRTIDCAGGSGADQTDLVVGTKSPTAGQGTIEIWSSDNATTPTFSRLETYPTVGAIPGNALGEVNAISFADLNGDGLRDMIVGTKTGNYTGQLLIFKNNGKTAGTSRFTLAQLHAIAGSVTCIAPTKVDYDTLTDLIIGVQTGVGSGELQEFHNATFAGIINFAYQRKNIAPGIVLSVKAVDLGGVAGHDDLVMGWRQNETSYVGGLQVFSLDAGWLPASPGADPSAGSVINMVPALTANNFNYGVQPVVPPPPYLQDIAAGVKVSATTGALVVFVR